MDGVRSYKPSSAERREAAKSEFNYIFKNWVAQAIDWKAKFPIQADSWTKKLVPEKVAELMTVPMGTVRDRLLSNISMY